jgi:hypothetical protein
VSAVLNAYRANIDSQVGGTGSERGEGEQGGEQVIFHGLDFRWVGRQAGG